jgi:3-oxoacyl-[acyl-carrier protein] reductase
MKQVLITGGATGIGAATAQVFLERGYRVFVTVHQTAAELPGVTAIPCDITDPADVERLFAAVGTVDVLVNNAGISLIRQIQDTTPEDYDALMGVNCKGVFLCSRAAAVDMLRRHSGAIVNVSSMWGQVGASCETVYSMSKAGVIGFTRALAQELAPEGIAVNCVAPGEADNPGLAHGIHRFTRGAHLPPHGGHIYNGAAVAAQHIHRCRPATQEHALAVDPH